MLVGVGLGLGLGLKLRLELDVGVASVSAAMELSLLSVVLVRQTPAGSVVGHSTKAQVIASTAPAKTLVKSPQPEVICETMISGNSSSFSTMEPSSMALKSSMVSLTMASGPSMISDGSVRAMPTISTMRWVISLGDSRLGSALH